MPFSGLNHVGTGYECKINEIRSLVSKVSKYSALAGEIGGKLEEIVLLKPKYNVRFQFAKNETAKFGFCFVKVQFWVRFGLQCSFG